MPIRYPETDIPIVVFEGRCIVEEADALYSWLREAITPVADLGTCTELQTALLQLLLAMNVPIAVLPADPVLAACLAAALPRAAPANELALVAETGSAQLCENVIPSDIQVRQ